MNQAHKNLYGPSADDTSWGRLHVGMALTIHLMGAVLISGGVANRRAGMVDAVEEVMTQILSAAPICNDPRRHQGTWMLC